MNIKSSILILFHLATRIKWISNTNLVTVMNRPYLFQLKFNDPFYDKTSYSNSVLGFCQDLQLIYCCSFLDEFENQFNPKKFPIERDRILLAKKLTKPAYKRIKRWKDLKKIRNNILAHNHRLNGKPIYDFSEKLNYNVPIYEEEFILLADLVFMISQTIHYAFPNIVNKIDINESLLDHINFKSDKTNTFEEYKSIEKEMNDLRKAHG